MKNLVKIMLVFALILSTTLPFVDTSAEAKTKVYPVYNLYEDQKEFPKKLSNGLIIGKEYDEWGDCTPTVLKGKKKVWRALKQNIINPNGTVQFTVTTNKDTFLYYYSGASGAEGATLVGVHANGKVFFKKDYSSGAGLKVKFLSADKIEVSIERINKNWNPSIDSNAARRSGIWDVAVYTISENGKMKLVKKYTENSKN